jgi:hypothetical protein
VCVRACSLRAHSPVSLPCRRMQGEPSCAPARRSASAAQSAHALVSPLPRELECHATGTHRCGIRWRQRVCVLRVLTRVLWPRLERRRGRARAHHTAQSRKQRNQNGLSASVYRRRRGILAQHQTAWMRRKSPPTLRACQPHRSDRCASLRVHSILSKQYTRRYLGYSTGAYQLVEECAVLLASRRQLLLRVTHVYARHGMHVERADGGTERAGRCLLLIPTVAYSSQKSGGRTNRLAHEDLQADARLAWLGLAWRGRAGKPAQCRAVAVASIGASGRQHTAANSRAARRSPVRINSISRCCRVSAGHRRCQLLEPPRRGAHCGDRITPDAARHFTAIWDSKRSVREQWCICAASHPAA